MTPNIPRSPPALEALLLANFYRDRNTVECMFCRLKDFRRVATRYDRNVTCFPAAVHITVIVSYWL